MYWAIVFCLFLLQSAPYRKWFVVCIFSLPVALIKNPRSKNDLKKILSIYQRWRLQHSLNSLTLWEKLPGPFANRVKNEVRSGPRQRAAFGFNDSTWLAVLTDEASIHIQLIAASCKQPIHLHPSLTSFNQGHRVCFGVCVCVCGKWLTRFLKKTVACMWHHLHLSSGKLYWNTVVLLVSIKKSVLRDSLRD